MAWESGLPYSTLRQRIVEEAISPALEGLTENVPVSRWIYASPTRNHQRNENFINVDLRVAREFHLGQSVITRLTVEVLNALDDRSYRIYPGERAYGRRINGLEDATSRYGRRYQLGLEVAF